MTKSPQKLNLDREYFTFVGSFLSCGYNTRPGSRTRGIAFVLTLESGDYDCTLPVNVHLKVGLRLLTVVQPH